MSAFVPDQGVEMPALALRGINIFPHMLVHFDVVREASIKAVNEAMGSSQPIFLVAQKDLSLEAPGEDDLWAIGTIAAVKQILRLPDNNVRVMVEGSSRGKMLRLCAKEPYLLAQVETISAAEDQGRRTSPKMEAYVRQAYSLLEKYMQLSDRVTSETYLKAISSDDPGYLADYIAQNIPMRHEDKQAILEELIPGRRLEKLVRILTREVDILEVEGDLEAKIREQVAANQKEYFLREQLKVIRRELGEGEGDDEISEYRARIAKAKLPGAVRAKLEKEVSRLEKQPFGSAEAAVERNYLDICLELPWLEKTRERANVAAARKVLDADHFGLEKVKERILEYIAVKQLSPELKGQILCLVGPPGVGKTSIAASVARALNRKMGRISLGGVHDEAEIRGHRKTYVGAMPGRIITAIRQAGTANPLLLLDEIDKVGTDSRGDPASALLEVLDSEQNATFRDHFLELPFDLSDVMFITTANTTQTIPRALLDRMEIIELTSYTDEEKYQIARRYLLPRQLERHGLAKGQVRVTAKALHAVIAAYTRESGVRQLERELGALCRKAAMEVVEGDVKQITITEKNLKAYLGVCRYPQEKLAEKAMVGVVNGLAWTSVGGEILEVEANVVPGSGKIELTGNLGDVMKESAHAALSYIRSRSEALGIEPTFYKDKDIHVHFPEGAVPKDGPSAGIAIATAMVSALTGRPVRQDVAMTGEITLRGRVLAIGGLKEKTMAALRHGVGTVILPADNVKDLDDIDQTVRASLHFVPVEQADAVIDRAILPAQEPKALCCAGAEGGR